MKMLDKNSITTYQPKYIELRHGVIINGQYHLKDGLIPVPFNTIPFNEVTHTDTGNSLLFTDKAIYKQCHTIHSGSDCDTSKIIYDNEDENISYVLFHSQRDRIELKKFEEKNGKCILLATNIFSTTSISYRIIDFTLNNNKICVTSIQNIGVCWIYKYDKSLAKLSGDDVHLGNGINTPSSYYSTASKIGDCIYSATGPYFDTYAIDEIYNKTDYYRFDFCNATYGARMVVQDAFISELTQEAYIPSIGTRTDSAQPLLNFKKVTYNKVTKKFESMTVAIDNTDGVYNISTEAIFFHNIFHREIAGKKYIILTFGTKEHNREWNSALFEIISDESIKFVKPLGTEILTGIHSGIIRDTIDPSALKFYFGYKIADGGDVAFRGVKCLEFNDTTLDFDTTIEIPGEINVFGLDKQNNLFIQHADKSVDKHSPTLVATLEAKFASEFYDYSGEDILTSMKVATKNVAGDYLVKKAKLTLKGNGLFTDTGNKVIEVTTLETGDLDVNVTINGTGAITIFPKVEV